MIHKTTFKVLALASFINQLFFFEGSPTHNTALATVEQILV
jgi:hypothetical protein